MGVLLPDATRLAPLRVLEHPELSDIWRTGDEMRKGINLRKTVIYAIHRRLTGGPKTASDAAPVQRMGLEGAFADLRGLLGPMKVKESDPQHKKDGVSRLANGALSKELSPDLYEKHYALMFQGRSVFDHVDHAP